MSFIFSIVEKVVYILCESTSHLTKIVVLHYVGEVTFSSVMASAVVLDVVYSAELHH